MPNHIILCRYQSKRYVPIPIISLCTGTTQIALYRSGPVRFRPVQFGKDACKKSTDPCTVPVRSGSGFPSGLARMHAKIARIRVFLTRSGNPVSVLSAFGPGPGIGPILSLFPVRSGPVQFQLLVQVRLYVPVCMYIIVPNPELNLSPTHTNHLLYSPRIQHQYLLCNPNPP